MKNIKKTGDIIELKAILHTLKITVHTTQQQTLQIKWAAKKLNDWTQKYFDRDATIRASHMIEQHLDDIRKILENAMTRIAIEKKSHNNKNPL